MKVGIFSYNVEYSLRADHLARAAEARGFESLWVPEHTHIPVPRAGEKADPETGMPMAAGDLFFLPEQYRHMSDPFTTLAAAAAVTTTLKLGTCVCLINQHHPINLAKQVACLDRLADGRFIFGIGAGWYEPELAHHGIRVGDRWRQLRERLRAVRTLWAEDKASFSGEFVNFAESWQYPKPLQPEGPQVVLGTLDTEFGRRQVARHGDGWLPLTFDLEQTVASIADVRRQMEEFGRDPQALDVSLFFLGDDAPSAETLRKAGEIGATRAILSLPPAADDEVMRALDRYADLVNRAAV